MTVPLSILDLAPLVSGGTVGDALRRTLDLARRAEQFGYHRYWVAEHHLTAGVASSQPALLLGQIAAVTERIRLGSGAVQTGYLTPLAVLEQFGLLDALYPGRFDLGLGRSAQRRFATPAAPATPTEPAAARVVDGLLIPKHFDFTPLATSARAALFGKLLKQPGAEPPGLDQVVEDLQTLIAGPYTDDLGNEAHAVPGEGADLELWILGSSGGESARVAGARGLPFAANYHVAPAKVLEAVEAYRAAFRPSKTLSAPHVLVSADVVVAEDDDTAKHLAIPYGLWVRSIRNGTGAIPYPSVDEALAHAWSDEDRDLVADRLDTHFVGSPRTVAEQLETLRRVTGADELLVTTITHDHADRVRSFELLAKEWIA
ncbi:putative monooxygenase (luciferase-like) [Paractinoplanes abujensis]|uniref:Alkanesulfonate monooxygenase SsuD/methylene tetrahydromethanopterin reductase-like flavin-dependent oxidoreductase (Luciferase family) n=1 Tax=Paractinoplanes abujensis TaxID=882441 RepID=A0A7W7G0E1_9ACTN|nr:LLM class flavin-dependent oxidoreductase [Actinoplanes abujensis]MBB4691045.1 alkanesulfonate monooxygenase SsuD/methylene tetrahydromethanopterin reductase-like flavin-dependent oxidoreductase (luciferase family) [Actinoplanes abujensis]GID17542.1 putative monooxygenase (luciferase-like) [Actinoplanes abujensis]